MPFIPHTESEIKAMLAALNVDSIDTLFDEIPRDICVNNTLDIPAGQSEMEVTRRMQARARRDESRLCFIGAGAYEHYIPAAVWEIADRGEFMTAYTPYQAEASQGTLQVIYEYQTMMANLMSMAVSNASLYDGASALAEAVLMAVRANRKSTSRRVLLPATLHPAYREVVKTITGPQKIECVELPYCTEAGGVVLDALKRLEKEDFAAVVISQPNFFGALEDVDAITDWAHAHGALVIGVVNPMAMALLKPPGQWGKEGADIACGEGQPLGVPLSSGGPYFGFLCCKKETVRQMPGRIVGRTMDRDGKEGFVLTLQAREQHIRRSKATSNICTNQGLMVLAATIYMSLLGPSGLRDVALKSHKNATLLKSKLLKIPDVTNVFSRPFFHEFVIRLNKPVATVLDALADEGIQGGYDLGRDYPELADCLLLCATETKTETDLNDFANVLQRIMK